MIQLDITCPRCAKALSFLLSNDAVTLQCSYCYADVGKSTPAIGYLYALRNDSMPGLLKIGFTTREVGERVSELNSSTATPTPFEVAFCFVCTEPQSDEVLAHKVLAGYRLNEAREFFKIKEFEALTILRQHLSRNEVYLGAGVQLGKSWDGALEAEILQLRGQWSSTAGAAKGVSLIYRLISEQRYLAAKRVVELFLSDNLITGLRLSSRQKLMLSLHTKRSSTARNNPISDKEFIRCVMD